MFYIASNHYIVHKDCYIFLIVKMFITIFLLYYSDGVVNIIPMGCLVTSL